MFAMFSYGPPEDSYGAPAPSYGSPGHSYSRSVSNPYILSTSGVRGENMKIMSGLVVEKKKFLQFLLLLRSKCFVIKLQNFSESKLMVVLFNKHKIVTG